MCISCKDIKEATHSHARYSKMVAARATMHATWLTQITHLSPLLQTICDSTHTKREVAQAKTARQQMARLGYSSSQATIDMLDAGMSHCDVRPLLMVESKPRPKKDRFWKVYLVCLLQDFWLLITVMVLSPRFTESKKVNLYRIYSICAMLCVCGVRCARYVRYVYSFCVEKRPK
jgi:hypothetical protein